MESSGALAGGVLELTQNLAKFSRQIKDRGLEKERLASVQAEFRKHLNWQQKRKQDLRRDIERLHNEATWLHSKTRDVLQDSTLIGHEIRQCRTETDQAR